MCAAPALGPGWCLFAFCISQGPCGAALILSSPHKLSFCLGNPSSLFSRAQPGLGAHLAAGSSHNPVPGLMFLRTPRASSKMPPCAAVLPPGKGSKELCVTPWLLPSLAGVQPGHECRQAPRAVSGSLVGPARWQLLLPDPPIFNVGRLSGPNPSHCFGGQQQQPQH